jgi:hypothetical protein
MEDDVRLLEQRVRSAVDRLKRVHDERDRLREEVQTLGERLERSVEGRVEDDPGSGRSWQSERAEVLAAVREALDELRDP